MQNEEWTMENADGETARFRSEFYILHPAFFIDRLLESHPKNSSAGSTRTVSGSHATGAGSGRSGSILTASFSVVTTIAAPALRMAAAMRARSPRV